VGGEKLELFGGEKKNQIVKAQGPCGNQQELMRKEFRGGRKAQRRERETRFASQEENAEWPVENLRERVREPKELSQNVNLGKVRNMGKGGTPREFVSVLRAWQLRGKVKTDVRGRKIKGKKWEVVTRTARTKRKKVKKGKKNLLARGVEHVGHQLQERELKWGTVRKGCAEWMRKIQGKERGG